MTDKQIKEEIKQVVTNLYNIEFTVEDELKFCKEVLKRKEQECEELKKTFIEIKEMCNSVENIENVKSLYDAALSGMYLQANKILQKISECEVENEN